MITSFKSEMAKDMATTFTKIKTEKLDNLEALYDKRKKRKTRKGNPEIDF